MEQQDNESAIPRSEKAQIRVEIEHYEKLIESLNVIIDTLHQIDPAKDIYSIGNAATMGKSYYTSLRDRLLVRYNSLLD